MLDSKDKYSNFEKQMIQRMEITVEAIEGGQPAEDTFDELLFGFQQDLADLVAGTDSPTDEIAINDDDYLSEASDDSNYYPGKKRKSVKQTQRDRHQRKRAKLSARKRRCSEEGCGRKFITARGLREHQIVHVNAPKRYHCTFGDCTFETHYRRNVVKHVLAKHFGLNYNRQRRTGKMAAIARTYIGDTLKD